LKKTVAVVFVICALTVVGPSLYLYAKYGLTPSDTLALAFFMIGVGII
jgi:hypothetical protein